VREITLDNIQTSQAGTYVATNTNHCGAQASVSFSIVVNSDGNGGLAGDYRIVNRNSGKCLIPNNGASADATDIVQYTRLNYDYEIWTVTEIGPGVYSIVNAANDKYADIYGASSSAGAHNIIWPYTGGDNQKWRIIDQGDGYYHITNVNSGLLLDMEGSSTSNNAYNVQWTDSGGFSQDWSFVPAD
jgi:hypothetical protein